MQEPLGASVETVGFGILLNQYDRHFLDAMFTAPTSPLSAQFWAAVGSSTPTVRDEPVLASVSGIQSFTDSHDLRASAFGNDGLMHFGGSLLWRRRRDCKRPSTIKSRHVRRPILGERCSAWPSLLLESGGEERGSGGSWSGGDRAHHGFSNRLVFGTVPRRVSRAMNRPSTRACRSARLWVRPSHRM